MKNSDTLEDIDLSEDIDDLSPQDLDESSPKKPPIDKKAVLKGVGKNALKIFGLAVTSSIGLNPALLDKYKSIKKAKEPLKGKETDDDDEEPKIKEKPIQVKKPKRDNKKEPEFKEKVDKSIDSTDEVRKKQEELVDFLSKKGEAPAAQMVADLIDNQNKKKVDLTDNRDIKDLIKIDSRILDELRKINAADDYKNIKNDRSNSNDEDDENIVFRNGKDRKNGERGDRGRGGGGMFFWRRGGKGSPRLKGEKPPKGPKEPKTPNGPKGLGKPGKMGKAGKFGKLGRIARVAGRVSGGVGKLAGAAALASMGIYTIPSFGPGASSVPDVSDTPETKPNEPKTDAKADTKAKAEPKSQPKVEPKADKAGRLAERADRAGAKAFGKGLGKGALKAGARLGAQALKAVPGLGLAVTAAMAVFDAVDGWQNAGENLGIAEDKLTTTNKASSAAGSVVSGLTFGLVDAKDASKGINNFFGGNEIIEKYEKLGIIDHNSLGNSTIEDWNKVRELKPEEIQEIIDIDDWSEKDLKHLKQCQSDVVKGIKKEEKDVDKGVLDYLQTGALRYTPIGIAASAIQSIGDAFTSDVGEHYEDEGIIEYNVLGDSEVTDWKKLYTLKPDEIDELINFADFDEETMWKLRKAKEDVENGITTPPDEGTKIDEKKDNVSEKVDELKKSEATSETVNSNELASELPVDEFIEQLEEKGIVTTHFIGNNEISDISGLKDMPASDIKKIIDYGGFSVPQTLMLNKIYDDKTQEENSKKEERIENIKSKASLTEMSDVDKITLDNLDNLSAEDLDGFENLVDSKLEKTKSDLYAELQNASISTSLDEDTQSKLDKVIALADKLDAIEEEQRKSYLKASGDTAENPEGINTQVVSDLSAVHGTTTVSMSDPGSPSSENYSGDTQDTSGVASAEGPKLDLSNIQPVSISDASGDLGSYVKQFESGNRGPEAIGYDSGGGTSYGSYQIASNTGTMNSFLGFAVKNGGQFGQELAKNMSENRPYNTGSVKGAAPDVWKQFAAVNGGKDLGILEHAFIKSTHYDVAYKGLSNHDLVDKDRGLQEALWSASVQHGPGGAAGIFNKTYKEGITPQDWLTAIYEERGKRSRFSKVNDKVYAGVKSRFEKEVAIVKGLSNSVPANASASQDSASSIPTENTESIQTTAQPQTQPQNALSSVSAPAGSGTPSSSGPGFDETEGDNPVVDTNQQPPASAAEAIAKLKSLGVNANQVTTGGGGWTSVSHINPEMLGKFALAEEAFKRETGHVVNISSAWRSEQDQTKLRATQNNAARGRSRHQTGIAMDLVSDDGSKTMGTGWNPNSMVAKFEKVSQQFGIYRPLKGKKNEEQHFELKGGRVDPSYSQSANTNNAKAQIAPTVATPESSDADYQSEHLAQQGLESTNNNVNSVSNIAISQVQQLEDEKDMNYKLKDLFLTPVKTYSDMDIILNKNRAT